MELSKEEKELIIRSLQMRKNYMETRDPALSARDAINMEKPNIVRFLDSDQCILRVEIDNLIKKLEK